jgi:hypothetical protein
MMRENKAFYFIAQPYDWAIYVAYNMDDISFNKYFEKELPLCDIERNFSIATTHNFVSKQTEMPSGYILLDIRKRLNRDELIEVLAHEVSHIVYYLTRDIGLKLSNESSEAFAYLSGYILMKIYKKMTEEKHAANKTKRK